MTALTQDRNTPRMQGGIYSGAMKGAVKAYAGSLLVRDANGYVKPGVTATGLVGVGRAAEQVDNSGGSDGDLSIRYEAGVFRFGNSASADLIAQADIGKPCYVVDDQTVAKTSATNTRSIAGFIAGVDSEGVWVRFDEAMTQTYVAGIANPAA